MDIFILESLICIGLCGEDRSSKCFHFPGREDKIKKNPENPVFQYTRPFKTVLA